MTDLEIKSFSRDVWFSFDNEKQFTLFNEASNEAIRLRALKNSKDSYLETYRSRLSKMTNIMESILELIKPYVEVLSASNLESYLDAVDSKIDELESDINGLCIEDLKDEFRYLRNELE